MKGIGSGIIIVLFSIFVLIHHQGKRVQAEGIKSNIIAHRGLSRSAPENTLSSIMLAAKEKADYAELDVQETKDGKVVLMHDRSLKRVGGVNKQIKDMNYNDLEQVDVGKLYSPQFKGEKVPTLENVIINAKGKVKLDIEIKPYGREKDLTEKVVALIEKYNFENQCIVTSFSYDILTYVKLLNPRIKTSYIISSKVNSVNSKYIDIYSVDRHYVNDKLIKDIHKNKKKVHVWTVDNKVEMEQFLNLKVDGIITDDVDGLKDMENNNVNIFNNDESDLQKVITKGSEAIFKKL